jgi:RNA polymerase sigma-70 factor, ECF subfamily
VPDEEIAETVVQEAYLLAFSDIERYEPTGKFGAWLARLAFNQALALRRTVRPLTSAPVTLESAGDPTKSGASSTTDTPSDSPPSRQMIEQAIDALPEVFRTVFVLRAVEGISGIETAASLGLHETTVRTRLYRAHRRLSPEMARRVQATPGVLEPSAAVTDRIVGRALARLVHGSMLTISASPP